MARQPKRKKEEMIQRTAKWPLSLSPEQEALIVKVSDGLREWYNWALDTEKSAYETHRAALKEDPEAKPKREDIPVRNRSLHPVRPLRGQDASDGLFRAKVPANWVLETFKAAVAGYKSFFALVKNGDPDARTPKSRDAGYFQAIPGCSAFSKKGNRMVLAPEIFGPDTLAFLIRRSTRRRCSRVRYGWRSSSSAATSRAWPSQDASSFPYRTRSRFLSRSRSRRKKRRTSRSVPRASASFRRQARKSSPLWRADAHWKPRTDAIQASLGRPAGTPGHPRALKKGSLKWRKLEAKRRGMFRIMGEQQKIDRREVVAIELLDVLDGIARGCVHFVVTDLVVRSKEGKLADSSKEERGGNLGLNWAAQNTGTIAYLVQWLTEKARNTAARCASIGFRRAPFRGFLREMSGRS